MNDNWWDFENKTMCNFCFTHQWSINTIFEEKCGSMNYWTFLSFEMFSSYLIYRDSHTDKNIWPILSVKHLAIYKQLRTIYIWSTLPPSIICHSGELHGRDMCGKNWRHLSLWEDFGSFGDATSIVLSWYITFTILKQLIVIFVIII